ncbi:MAG TPA: hypothetical protein PKD09_07835 [Aggregatilinea sp.]|uniref:hypothetical protein n=1 Tax=Aggregatilinea sp. TaxID=2806333 RepID=UPI002C343D72|nr:hypothetical protein [Aggregatilinea sp.]HML21540.1 hypothetical protein [Aggregatilinea sp.]
MKTIFAMFDTYKDAKSAVEGLLERDFASDQINVLLQESVAKNGQDEGDGTATLDQVTAGEQPVPLTGSGPVIAAGTLATMLAKSAAAPGTGGGLRAALVDLSIPDTVAEAFASGVQEGKILFCVKCDDDRAEYAQTALVTHSARYAGDYNTLPTDDQL